MVDVHEFYRLVWQMRNEQKSYFRTRSKEALMRSKALERHVDDEVSEYDAHYDLFG